jgi:hypothetical protein
MSTAPTVIQALRELLIRDLLRDDFVLSEDAPNSKCQPTQLKGTSQTVLVRLQQPNAGPSLPEWLFPLFAKLGGAPPVCRSCDYLLFHLSGVRGRAPQVFVFAIELKSQARKTYDALPQLRNGMLLAKYVLDVLKLYWPSSPSAQIEYRGLVVAPDAPRTRPSSALGKSAVAYLHDDKTGLRYVAVRSGTELYLNHVSH